MKNFRKNQGITLISLVVTIIVLLILAGVTISALSGDNGILTKAQEAKEQYEEAAKNEEQQLAGVFERNYVSYNGQLHVDGTKLMNEHDEEVRLKGTVLLNNSNLTFDKELLSSLKEWGTNVIKVGLGNADSSHSYTNIDYMNKMYKIIDDAIDLDMYVVVIFWSGSNLRGEIYNQANEYFTQIVTRYKDVPNLIYEIANEPKQEWNEIKVYANQIIPLIRNISKNALILCPARGHNAVDEIIGNELEIENVMYVSHIYAGDDGSCIKLINAILNNVPVFESEWFNSDGESIVNESYDLKTLKFIATMDKYNISSTFFIMCESDDTRTFFVKKGEWSSSLTDDILDECGKYAKMYITGDYSLDSNIYSVEDYTIRNGLHGDYKMCFWADKYRSKITNIITTTNCNIPNDAIETWVLSNGSGKILSYILNNNSDDGYTVYICTDYEKIYPVNGWRLFSNFGSLETIDLTYFDTSNITNMADWFSNDINLKSIIGLNKFNTYKTTNMSNMFYQLSNIEELDLSSFDFQNVDNYNNIFYQLKNGIKIYTKDEISAQGVSERITEKNITGYVYYKNNDDWIEYIN